VKRRKYDCQEDGNVSCSLWIDEVGGWMICDFDLIKGGLCCQMKKRQEEFCGMFVLD